MSPPQQNQYSPTRHLTRHYIIALCAVALWVMIGQIFTRYMLMDQVAAGGPARLSLEIAWLSLTLIGLLLAGLFVFRPAVNRTRRAMSLMQESESRSRELFDEALIGYHEIDSDGHITRMNQTALAMLGFTSEEEVLGRHLSDFTREPEQTREEEVHARLTGAAAHAFCERTIKRQDGTSFLALVRDQDLKDQDGRIIGLRSTLQDMTEPERIMQDRSLLDGLPAIVYRAEPVPPYSSIYISQHAASLGYTLDEWYQIPNFWITILHPDDRAWVLEETAQALTTTGRNKYLYRVIAHDGAVHWLHHEGHIWADEAGRPVCWQGGMIDITDRQRMESEITEVRDMALEAARLKSEFIANMSHELRTPMNGVLGMTALLLDTSLDADQLEFAETIRSSTDALLNVIDDILDFSKIEAGNLRFDLVDFDLYYVVEGTMDLFASRARDKKIELASLVYSTVPTLLRGDPGRLRQVLTNLIGNAMKFTEAGEIVVRASKIFESDSHVSIRFVVTDTGIGISEEAQGRLFQAFTQADGSATRKYGGTGLGLAISKQLVELMGGEIGVRSTPGEGSTFWFTVRFEKQPAGEVSTPLEKAQLDGARVLIVDDNQTNRKIFRYQLNSWNMISVEADSGARALELLRFAAHRHEAFDLAILDFQMADMDGFELARAIKTDPLIAPVQLVLLPSCGMRGHAEMASEIGIAAYMTKPVRQSQLFECLTRVLGESSMPTPGAAMAPVVKPKIVTRHLLEETSAHARHLILLAEDNVVNQKVAMRQLKNLGLSRVDVVTNGIEALEAMEKRSYDLVLMDCQMPQMDGYETTVEIRKRQTAHQHTVIVAMTARATDGDRERCLLAGMDDYLSKPVEAEQLREVLKRWLPTPLTAPGAPASGAFVHDTTGDALTAETTAPGFLRAPLEETIDPSVLAAFKELQEEGEPDIVAELIDLFLLDAGPRLELLRAGAARDDTPLLKHVLHTLKGSCGNLGARRMAKLCSELEEVCGRHPASAQISALLLPLEEEFARVRQALELEKQASLAPTTHTL